MWPSLVVFPKPFYTPQWCVMRAVVSCEWEECRRRNTINFNGNQHIFATYDEDVTDSHVNVCSTCFIPFFSPFESFHASMHLHIALTTDNFISRPIVHCPWVLKSISGQRMTAEQDLDLFQKMLTNSFVRASTHSRRRVTAMSERLLWGWGWHTCTGRRHTHRVKTPRNWFTRAVRITMFLTVSFCVFVPGRAINGD